MFHISFCGASIDEERTSRPWLDDGSNEMKASLPVRIGGKSQLGKNFE